jgi:hypothetical protein
MHTCPDCDFAYDLHGELFILPEREDKRRFRIRVLGVAVFGLCTGSIFLRGSLCASALLLVALGVVVVLFATGERLSRRPKLLLSRRGITVIDAEDEVRHFDWDKVVKVSNTARGAPLRLQYIDGSSETFVLRDPDQTQVLVERALQWYAQTGPQADP